MQGKTISRTSQRKTPDHIRTGQFPCLRYLVRSHPSTTVVEQKESEIARLSMMGCQVQQRLFLYVLVRKGVGAGRWRWPAFLLSRKSPQGQRKVGGVRCSAPPRLPELFSEGEAGKGHGNRGNCCRDSPDALLRFHTLSTSLRLRWIDCQLL